MAKPAVAAAHTPEGGKPAPAKAPGATHIQAGDFWGGLSAMLVALPSAIAFGVTIYAPLGASYASQGAIAGILGTAALGIIAAAFGGTKRLITAPCAPAVAVLSAFAITLTHEGVTPASALLLMSCVALICALLQIVFGLIGLGRLIKYMPYPVVSGYLSGVGLLIIISQVPKFLGVSGGHDLWHALLSPALWKWQSVAVGGVTILVMVLAPRVTKAIPAAILGLLFGLLTYFAIAMADRSLLVLAGNKLIIGPLGGSDAGFVATMASRWKAIGAFHPEQLKLVLAPALTLAVLLSIDTLKTCVVLDTLTCSRHKSNRELIGQGLGNLAATSIGGIPGAGQMGATLVNISSGGQTRLSGIVEGVLALFAFVLLGSFIAWVPVAALAGILLVVGVRMFDRHSLSLLKSRSTILDFVIIVTVVIVAETVSLVAASGVGIGLAVLLFLRAQTGAMVVRRKSYGNRRFSRQMRLPQEMAILEQRGENTAVFELQGNLFFGTTDQLYTELEPELTKRNYIVLDMRRVESVDFTAAHMLELVEDMMAERQATLLFSHMPSRAPSGQDMARYFDQVGLVRKEHHARIFPHLDEALEWIEDRILEEAHLERAQETPLELNEFDMFRQHSSETLAALQAAIEIRTFEAGRQIFARGDTGDELFLIRKGSVRILMPLERKAPMHLTSFGRGDFFGELAFLDRAPRSADAVAYTDIELYVLTRERFDALSDEHRNMARDLLQGIASGIALRLRRTNIELRALKES